MITLNFIGENTQYSLFSANLSSGFIKDFRKYWDKYSKTRSKVKATKHLSLSIKTAQQLLDGDIPFSSIPEINKTLKQKRHGNLLADSKSVERKLVELQRLIPGHEGTLKNSKSISVDKLQPYETFLRGIIERNSIEQTGVGLCDVLIELSKINLVNSLIQPYNIQELLAKIEGMCSKSSSSLVKDIGKVISLLRNHWENLLRPDHRNGDIGIADKNLRKLVCKKIAAVLENNHFDEKDAREIALNIERKIRMMDPSMSNKYRKCFRRMITDIKQITSSVYNEIKLLPL